MDSWSELLSYTATSLADELTKQGVQKLTGWAKKEVSEEFARLQDRVFTYGEQKAILDAAPESYDPGYNFQSGATLEELFAKVDGKELAKCISELKIKGLVDIEDIDLITTLQERENLDTNYITTTEFEQLIQASQLCGFGKIAELKTQLGALEKTIEITTKTITNLRKLDMCLPGPDLGWEVRMMNAFGKARNRLTTKLFKAKSDTGKQANLEEYAALLDTGINNLSEGMYKYSTFPGPEYRIPSGPKYKAMVNRAESLFGFIDTLKEEITNYSRVIQRLEEIQYIYENGIDEDLKPLTSERRLALMNEVYSYLQKVTPDDDSESPVARFKQAVNLQKQVQLMVDNTSVPLDGGPTPGPDCFDERRENKMLNDTESWITFKNALSQPTARVDASVFLSAEENNDTADSQFGVNGSGLDEAQLKDVPAIDEFNITIRGGTTTTNTNASTTTPPASEEYQECMAANPDIPGACTHLLNNQNGNINVNSTSTTTPQESLVDTLALEKATEMLNQGVIGNFKKEYDKDTELRYYCASVFNATYESYLLVGFEWEGSSTKKKNIFKARDWFNFQRNPSSIYRGFSCANFYFSKSVSDYNPSVIRSAY